MAVPSKDFFEVFPADEVSERAAKETSAVYSTLRWLFWKKIRIYALAKQLFRTYSLYGRSISKTGPRVVMEDGIKKVYPAVRAVDPFMFYTWPETVSDLDACDLIVEDFILSYDRYKDYADTNRAESIAPTDLEDFTWPFHITRRLLLSGVPDPHSSAPGNEGGSGSDEVRKRNSEFVYGSEVWINVGSGWKFCWIVWNLKEPKVVRVSKKTFARPQYRMCIAREIPGEQYTTGMGDDLEPIQILQNDQLNMHLEGQAMTFGGPVAIDPFQISRHPLNYRPRAKWLIPPDAVKPVFTTATDVSRASFTSLQFSFGLMDTFSGSSPLAEGQTMRNLPRAGFAVSSLLSLSLSDIRDAAQSLEEDIFGPMLKDCFDIMVNYVPENQVFRIPGARDFPPRALTIKNLEGDWDFLWVGSLGSQQFQEKSQRLMAFVGALGKMGEVMIADLQSKGKRINWTVLLRRMWREGLGERGLEDIIEDRPMQVAAPVPGAPMEAEGEGGGGQQQQFVDIDRLVGMLGQTGGLLGG